MDPVSLGYLAQIEGEITRRVAELVRVVDLEKATVRTLQRELELKLGRDLTEHKNFIRAQVRVEAMSRAFVDGRDARRGSGCFRPGSASDKAPRARRKGSGTKNSTRFEHVDGARRSDGEAETDSL